MEAAVIALKKGKSAGVDNIPAELVQAEGEAMIDILTSICNKIWKIEWPTTWTQSLVITLPKNGNLQLCQNYRTVSLISHPSKVMLKIIRLQPQAEEVIADEQAGFRAGRSTDTWGQCSVERKGSSNEFFAFFIFIYLFYFYFFSFFFHFCMREHLQKSKK